MDHQSGTVVAGEGAEPRGDLDEDRVSGVGRQLRPERVHGCRGRGGVAHRHRRHVAPGPVLDRRHLRGVHPPRSGGDGHQQDGPVEPAGADEGVGGQPCRVVRVETGVLAVDADGGRCGPVVQDESRIGCQRTRVECPPQGGPQRADQRVHDHGVERDPRDGPGHHGSVSSTGAPCLWRTVLRWTAAWVMSAITVHAGRPSHSFRSCRANRASRSDRSPGGIGTRCR